MAGTKTAPFTMRLPVEMDEAAAAEARASKRSKGAVLTELADEALRCRMFPGIAFRGDYPRRRPWVIGTALDVWEVIWLLRDLSVEELVDAFRITERQARTARAYYERYREEIDAWIADIEGVSEEELRRRYPHMEFHTVA